MFAVCSILYIFYAYRITVLACTDQADKLCILNCNSFFYWSKMAILNQRSKSSIQSADREILGHSTYDQLLHKYLDIDSFNFAENETCRDASEDFKDDEIAIDGFDDSDSFVSSPSYQWSGMIESPMVHWAQDQSTQQRNLYDDEASTVLGNYSQDAEKGLETKTTTNSFSCSPFYASNRERADSAEYHKKLRSIESTSLPAQHSSMTNKRIPRKSKSNPTMMRSPYYQPCNIRNRWTHHPGERVETSNFCFATCTPPTPHSQAAKHLSDVRAEAPQYSGLGISFSEQADEGRSNRNSTVNGNNIAYIRSDISTPLEEQLHNELYFQNLYIGSEAGQTTLDALESSPSYTAPPIPTYQRSMRWSTKDREDVYFGDDESVGPPPTYTQFYAQDNVSIPRSTFFNVMKQRYDPMLSTSSRAELYELCPDTSSLRKENQFPPPPEMSVRHSFCNMRESKRSDALPPINSAVPCKSHDIPSGGTSISSPTNHKRRSTSRGHSKSHSRKNSSQSKRALSSGFVNFTASDSERLLSGVAPSGSSKTKARREKEAEEKRRRLSEAATRAVMEAGGDIAVLKESGLLPDYLQLIARDTP